MAHETSVYPDPEKFDLNRWLDDAGQLNNNMNFPNFGFGRRCVLSPICRTAFSLDHWHQDVALTMIPTVSVPASPLPKGTT